MEYEAIGSAFPWTLTEVRELTRREREYFFRAAHEQIKRKFRKR